MIYFFRKDILQLRLTEIIVAIPDTARSNSFFPLASFITCFLIFGYYGP